MSIIEKFLPIATSKALPINFAGTINTFISTVINSTFTKLGDAVLNAPVIALNIFVMFLVFFYSLKEGKFIIDYLKSLVPLNNDYRERFFKQFKFFICNFALIINNNQKCKKKSLFLL